MNLSALYKRLQADGIETVELKLECDHIQGVNTLSVDVWPHGCELSDDALPLPFVAEVLGEEQVTSLWELVEDAAVHVINDRSWSKARVEFSVDTGEVRVRGWSKQRFGFDKKV